LLLALLAGLLSPTAARAAPPADTSDWRQLRTQSFAIIYPQQFEALAQVLYAFYGKTLDAEYQRFSTLFNASLPLPISIRVYPTVDEYYRLNSLAPTIGLTDIHSHIGYREISVIGNNVTADTARWQAAALDAFRFELAILFTVQASNQKAPPGLLAGVGGYAQDPATRMKPLAGQAPPNTAGQAPPNTAGQAADLAKNIKTWRTIFESDASLTDPDLQLQATSIVAYLVDEYGWDTFLKYLGSLASSAGYRQSASDTFGVSLDTLQTNWTSYYPFYLKERWNANVLYNYDLTKSQKLVAAGAYAAAVKELTADLAFLVRLQQTDKAKEAQTLLDQAIKGQEAGNLMYQAYQALQARDYAGSLELLKTARQDYAALGDDRQTVELDAYQKWAQTVLDLRSQVAQIASSGIAALDAGARTRLQDLYSQLSSYGDVEGQDMVRQALQTREDHSVSQPLLVILAAAGLCLLLLVARLLLARRPPAPEASL
jgi:hypothetical protein